jgi:glycosyltransferase involved in cell wall biosynthesis
VRLLLIGPDPPPHGGISVHVATVERLLLRSGTRCVVLDAGRRPGDGALAAVRSRLALLARVRRHARRGWTLHLHVSGHGPKSWLLALACGLAGRRAPGRVLTVHSGLVPGYLAGGPPGARALARLALRRWHRILCVSAPIRDAVAGLGVAPARLEVVPAHLPSPPVERDLPPALAAWWAAHAPLVSTALFFRPEYGFDVLLAALARLKRDHPGLGCLVMGSGEEEAAARRTVRERGMAEWVLLTGDLPHALCRTLIARSDVFVRPTLADGDALSVREALALGVPVVASDAAGRPPGTVLFPRGDAAALAARVDEVLGRAVAPRLAPAEGKAEGGIERLLRTYLELAKLDGNDLEPCGGTCSKS